MKTLAHMGMFEICSPKNSCWRRPGPLRNVYGVITKNQQYNGASSGHEKRRHVIQILDDRECRELQCCDSFPRRGHGYRNDRPLNGRAQEHSILGMWGYQYQMYPLQMHKKLSLFWIFVSCWHYGTKFTLKSLRSQALRVYCMDTAVNGKTEPALKL